MSLIQLKKKEDCMFDMISLGEVMLRLDPGEMRVRNARQFTVWEGGGEYNVAMTEEFMRAFAFNAGITLHTKVLYGNNSHHMVEALFKAVAHAMRLAVKENNTNQPLSTKGVL